MVTDNDIGKKVYLLNPPTQHRGKHFKFRGFDKNVLCEIEWLNNSVPENERILYTSMSNLELVI